MLSLTFNFQVFCFSMNSLGNMILLFMARDFFFLRGVIFHPIPLGHSNKRNYILNNVIKTILAWVSMTKYHRQHDLTNRSLSAIVLLSGSLRSGYQ